MVRVRALSCDYCGAPLEMPASGATLRCAYCERELLIEGTHARRTVATPEVSLPDRLLGGYDGRDVGQGYRLGVAEAQVRGWNLPTHTVWPISARATSQYGGGWGADALVGPPRVYPRCGDHRGAWAPGTRQSHTEWVQAHFPPGAPAATAIRVFETSMPGATFAVTVGEGQQEELVWQRAPGLTGNQAQLLEIPLLGPRVVRVVRAYVSNSLGSSWTEIDTIGLVTAAPVPRHLQPASPPPRRSNLAVVLVALGVVVALGVTSLVVVFGLARGTSPTPGHAPVPAPTTILAGARLLETVPDLAELGAERIRWASRVAGFSTEYGTPNWSAAQVLGAPDTYPRHGDLQTAWASREQNAGEEWLSVDFGEPMLARAVLIVETFNPGALARVDDVSRQSSPETLWAGVTPSSERSRVLRLELPDPRRISALRLVLDTRRVAGWSEIDAIGLVMSRNEN